MDQRLHYAGSIDSEQQPDRARMHLSGVQARGETGEARRETEDYITQEHSFGSIGFLRARVFIFLQLFTLKK